MKGQTVSALILAFACFGSTGGQLRVDPGEDCWFGSKCETTGAISEILISSLDFPVFDDKAKECHTECNNDITGTCTYFTLNQVRGSATCYLLSGCTESFNENCLDQETCVSGPKDCTTEVPNAKCSKITDVNTPAGTIHWQCTDKEGTPVNGYTVDDIEPQTTCILRCESWEDQNENDGYLQSVCEDTGLWSQTKANDDADELLFPLKPTDGEYPTPETESSLECGCKSLEVKGPVGEVDQTWWYDPNLEAGTDFVCDDQISTDDGEYIIETGNTCILFCDSHLVATVSCINGEWTGSPELGFWCYKQPEVGNQLTTTPKPDTGDETL